MDYPRRIGWWIRAVACIWLAAGVADSVEFGRDLLGSDVAFGKTKLEYFDLPKDAELILQSETDCPDPASIQIEAKNRALCQTTSRVRDCMNISATEPLWTARNCTQEYCVAENSYPETVCLLESYAIPVDIKNKTRRATCGLDPSDKIWLEPTLNFAAIKTSSENVSCSVVTPAGVSSHIWVDCVNGRPEFRYRLLFSEDRKLKKKRPFACVIIPTCIQNQWNSMMVCYKEGGGGKATKEKRNFKLMGEKSASVRTMNGIGCRLHLLVLFFILVGFFLIPQW
ncbi:hypothetical protein BSKO_12736 [Bryopsis sp. KO-2023]|nr:hypothetical protein BSKO_12736 [Bryopsis sp. KO-2023]